MSKLVYVVTALAMMGTVALANPEETQTPPTQDQAPKQDEGKQTTGGQTSETAPTAPASK